MIEINLLPEELNIKKPAYLKFDPAKMGKLKVLIPSVIAGVMVVVLLAVSLGSGLRKQQIIKLLYEENRLSTQKSNVEKLEKEVNLLQKKMQVLGEITKRPFLWAGKLNELSDLVLPGIWLTRMSKASNNFVLIEGSVISRKEEAMANVGKFIKNIKEHNTFFKDFSDIKLESVQRRAIGKQGIMDFRIAVYF